MSGPSVARAAVAGESVHNRIVALRKTLRVLHHSTAIPMVKAARAFPDYVGLFLGTTLYHHD